MSFFTVLIVSNKGVIDGPYLFFLEAARFGVIDLEDLPDFFLAPKFFLI